jgi:hypothetical protein
VTVALLVLVGLSVLVVVSNWRLYEKAGQPGWGALVPIYNVVLLVRIAGRSWWWVVLLLTPYVGAVFMIVVAIDLARNFGRGAGFGVGLAFLPMMFFPILAFGESRYLGPNGASHAGPTGASPD